MVINNEKVEIHTEYITLGQLLKYVGIVSNGSDVKQFLTENTIIVDNQKEDRRGRKIYKNMKIQINHIVYEII